MCLQLLLIQTAIDKRPCILTDCNLSCRSMVPEMSHASSASPWTDGAAAIRVRASSASMLMVAHANLDLLRAEMLLGYVRCSLGGCRCVR